MFLFMSHMLREAVRGAADHVTVHPFQFAEGQTVFITSQIDCNIIQGIVGKCKLSDPVGKDSAFSFACNLCS